MSNDATKNLGELGLLTTVSAGVVSIAGLATPFTQSGTGAVARTTQDKLRESVSVLDFGVNTIPGTTDMTAVVNAAITYVCNNYQGEWFLSTPSYSGSRVITFPSNLYKISGTIFLPSNITLDLCGSTLIGTGATSTDNNMFASGYVNSSGQVVSNLLTGNEMNRVMLSSIHNGIITNCGYAIKLKNFNENCSLFNLNFSNCYQVLDAQRCFYAAFHDMTYRSASLDSNTSGAFSFSNSANLHTIRKISVGQRKRAFEFSNISGTIITECSAEECTVGMWAQGALRATTFLGCYFEYCTSINIDLSSASCQEVTIQGCYLPLAPTAISIGAWTQGRITRDNNFIGCTVAIQVGQQSYGTVEIPQVAAADNYVPALPSTHPMTVSVDVDFPINVFDSGTGSVIFKQKYSPIVDLPYSGAIGTKGGVIPFCTYSTSLVSGSTYNYIIDTSIGYNDYATIIFAINVNYNGVNAWLKGRIIGADVYYDKQDAGKSITVSSNGSNFRLTLINYLNPQYVTGLIRHM